MIQNDSQLIIQHRHCKDITYDFMDCIDELISLSSESQPSASIQCSVLLYELIIFTGIAADERTERISDEERLMPVIDIINMYYSQRLTTNELADAIGVTANTLIRLFKIVYGTTPKEYISNVRIRRAKRLLLHNPNKSIKNIAYETGSSSPSHLISVFKAKEGITPEEYRNLHL